MRFTVKAILAAALFWGVYWFAAAQIIEHQIKALVARNTLLAADATSTVTGVPLGFHMTLRDVDWRSRDGLRAWQADAVTLDAASYWPNRIYIGFPEQQEIGLAGLTSRLHSTAMTAQTSFGADLILREALMTLGETRMEPPLFVDGLNGADMSLQRIESGTYSLSVQAGSLVFAAPVLAALDPDEILPDHLDGFQIDASLQFTGPIPLQGPLPRLTSMQVVNAQLDWGALKLTLDGQITRSEAGALDGQMILALQDWRPFHALLVSNGALPPDAAMMAGLFLAAQAQPGGHAVSLPLELRASVLSLGPFPVMRLPLF